MDVSSSLQPEEAPLPKPEAASQHRLGRRRRSSLSSASTSWNENEGVLIRGSASWKPDREGVMLDPLYNGSMQPDDDDENRDDDDRGMVDHVRQTYTSSRRGSGGRMERRGSTGGLSSFHRSNKETREQVSRERAQNLYQRLEATDRDTSLHKVPTADDDDSSSHSRGNGKMERRGSTGGLSSFRRSNKETREQVSRERAQDLYQRLEATDRDTSLHKVPTTDDENNSQYRGNGKMERRGSTGGLPSFHRSNKEARELVSRERAQDLYQRLEATDRDTSLHKVPATDDDDNSQYRGNGRMERRGSTGGLPSFHRSNKETQEQASRERAQDLYQRLEATDRDTSLHKVPATDDDDDSSRMSKIERRGSTGGLASFRFTTKDEREQASRERAQDLCQQFEAANPLSRDTSLNKLEDYDSLQSGSSSHKLERRGSTGSFRLQPSKEAREQQSRARAQDLCQRLEAADPIYRDTSLNKAATMDDGDKHIRNKSKFKRRSSMVQSMHTRVLNDPLLTDRERRDMEAKLVSMDSQSSLASAQGLVVYEPSAEPKTKPFSQTTPQHSPRGRMSRRQSTGASTSSNLPLNASMDDDDDDMSVGSFMSAPRSLQRCVQENGDGILVLDKTRMEVPVTTPPSLSRADSSCSLVSDDYAEYEAAQKGNRSRSRRRFRSRSSSRSRKPSYTGGTMAWTEPRPPTVGLLDQFDQNHILDNNNNDGPAVARVLTYGSTNDESQGLPFSSDNDKKQHDREEQVSQTNSTSRLATMPRRRSTGPAPIEEPAPSTQEGGEVVAHPQEPSDSMESYAVEYDSTRRERLRNLLQYVAPLPTHPTTTTTTSTPAIKASTPFKIS